MAAGFKINYNNYQKFDDHLNKVFEIYDNSYFEKVDYYDLKISIDEINMNLLDELEKLEPFGNGNEEPKFIVQNVKINNYKIIKEKHLLIFLKNSYGDILKGICFNSLDTDLGENIIKNKSATFEFGCNITIDNFTKNIQPQLIIRDALVIN